MKVKHKKDNVYVCTEQFVTGKDDSLINKGDYFYLNKNVLIKLSSKKEYKIYKEELKDNFKHINKNQIVDKNMLDISYQLAATCAMNFVLALFFIIFLVNINNYYLLVISTIITLELLYYAYLLYIKKEYEIIEINFNDVFFNKLLFLPSSFIIGIILTLIIEYYNLFITKIKELFVYMMPGFLYVLGILVVLGVSIYAFIKLNQFCSQYFIDKRGKK